jgi:hypothetical protein
VKIRINTRAVFFDSIATLKGSALISFPNYHWT